MKVGRIIAVLWVAWSIFGTLVFFVYATNPRVQALQQAGSAKGASAVIAEWNHGKHGNQTATARCNMTLDYGFVATFYPCMALASWVFARRNGWNLLAALFAGVAVVAGFCDLIEDVAMEFLWRAPTDLAAQIANATSHVKFVLAPAAFLFVLISGLTLLLRKNGV